MLNWALYQFEKPCRRLRTKSFQHTPLRAAKRREISMKYRKVSMVNINPMFFERFGMWILLVVVMIGSVDSEGEKRTGKGHSVGDLALVPSRTNFYGKRLPSFIT